MNFRNLIVALMTTLPAGQLPEMPAQTGENVTINANIDGDGKLDVMLTGLSGNRTST